MDETLWGEALPEAQAPQDRQTPPRKAQWVLTHIPKDGINPCVKVFGPGPLGKQCKTCQQLIRWGYHDKVYPKCALRGITQGPGTDHRVTYPACAKYKE